MFALHTNLYITNVCNRTCTYCYYPKDLEHMNIETAYDVAIWIENLCKQEKVEQYRCHFLGGEPFQNKEVLFFLVRQLEKHLPPTALGAKEGKYVVFTNGDLLDGDTLRHCKIKGIKLMYNPTYDDLSIIREKVDFIKDICGGVSLAVVADDKNLERLPALAQLAVDHNIHVRINRLYSGGKIPGYVEEFGKQMHRVFDILLAAEKPMWPNFIVESMTVTWPGPKNPNFCGKYFLVVDPDGSIRSCNGDIETKIGHITTHHKMSDFNFSHRWTAKNLPECTGCEWITWCQGGCPYTRKLAYGTYDKKSPFCSVFKDIFPMLMQLAKRWEKLQV